MPAPIQFKDLLRAKLPFWQTLQRAYALTFAHLGGLLTLSWKWMLMLLPFQLLYYWHAVPHLTAFYQQVGQPVITPMPLWVTIGAIVLGVLGYVMFSAPAVGWHRLILRNVRPSGVMEVDQPTLRYAGYVLLLYGLYNVPVLAMQVLTPEPGGVPSGGQLIGTIVSMIVMYVAIALFFRLVVFLPGVALDDGRASPANAWHATRGHTFRLLFGNLLAGLPFALVCMVATYFIITRADELTGTLLLPVAT